MIKNNVEVAINEQINAEIYSSYMYYAMAAYFESASLPGFATWMKLQAVEEMEHMSKFVDFLNNRQGRVVFKAIDAPPFEWSSPIDVFQAVYAHEVHVTELINTLVDLAIKESDHATVNFLQWFIAEQVEEEASVDNIVNKLKLVEHTQGGIFMLDLEMSKRQISLPADFFGGAK